MKTAKKLLALMLAFVMLCSLCACGKEGKLTKKELKGEWTATMDIDALTSVIGNDVFGPFSNLGLEMGQCTLAIQFDGKVATMKMDGLLVWYEQFLTNLQDWMAKGDNVLTLYAALLDDGTTPEDVAKMLTQEGLGTGDLLVSMQAQFDVETTIAELAQSLTDNVSKYQLDGNTLVFDSNEDGYKAIWTYSYTNGVITVTQINSGGQTVQLADGAFVMKK